MMRNVEKIKEIDPNWEDHCFNGNLGVEGEFYFPITGNFGQNKDDSVIDGNCPPRTQPGLWCQWEIDGDTLVWDGSEKFYHYVEWLEYMIEKFFEPLGYVLNGTISFYGEDDEDFGEIIVTDNKVEIKYGIHAMDLSEISNEDLLAECKRRGIA